MKKVFNQERELDNLYYVDNGGRQTVIDYVYHQGQLIWELIIGFLFSKGNESLQSKDGFIIKAKDQ